MSSFVTSQTVKRDSLFTRLDFRPKLFMVICVTAVAFLWDSPVAGGLLMLAITLVGLAAGVTWKYIRTVYILMFSFGLMLVFFHGFFNKDGVTGLVHGAPLTPLFTFPIQWPVIGGLEFTLEGFLYAMNALFKSLSMVLIIPLAIFTTDVNNVIVGMVKAGIPYKISFIFSSTLRFFPLLFEDVHSIIEAQRLRGLAMEKMNVIKKITVYAKVAIPLILGSLMKSQMLEVVLQSKSFSGSPDRTFLHESVLKTRDFIIIALFAVFLVASFVAYFAWGIGKFGWLIFK
jgi:energy-coupling factor transport system permease protein